MQIQRRQFDQAVVIWVEGRLDAAHVAEMKSQWTEDPNERRYVVELANTTFIDSLGLASLVSGLKAARQRGGDMVLVDPSPAVQTIFNLTAMDKVFRIVPSVQAALDLFVTDSHDD